MHVAYFYPVRSWTRLPQTYTDLITLQKMKMAHLHLNASVASHMLHLQIEDKARSRQIRVEKRGFPDAVLWNPWVAKSKGMSDFADEEYKVTECFKTPCLTITSRIRSLCKEQKRHLFS